MHPTHDGSFIALDRLRPLCGIALPTADHVQRLKAFPTAFVLGCYHQASHICQALVPFRKIWADHLDRPFSLLNARLGGGF
jgi:hypothetical protein